MRAIVSSDSVSVGPRGVAPYTAANASYESKPSSCNAAVSAASAYCNLATRARRREHASRRAARRRRSSSCSRRISRDVVGATAGDACAPAAVVAARNASIARPVSLGPSGAIGAACSNASTSRAVAANELGSIALAETDLGPAGQLGVRAGGPDCAGPDWCTGHVVGIPGTVLYAASAEPHGHGSSSGWRSRIRWWRKGSRGLTLWWIVS